MLINALQMGDGEHQRYLKHQMDASEMHQPLLVHAWEEHVYPGDANIHL